MSREWDDQTLSEHVRDLDVPDHEPEFFERLDHAMSGRAVAQERAPRRWRRPALAIAAVAVIAILVGVAVAHRGTSGHVSSAGTCGFSLRYHGATYYSVKSGEPLHPDGSAGSGVLPGCDSGPDQSIRVSRLVGVSPRIALGDPGNPGYLLIRNGYFFRLPSFPVRVMRVVHFNPAKCNAGPLLHGTVTANQVELTLGRAPHAKHIEVRPTSKFIGFGQIPYVPLGARVNVATLSCPVDRGRELVAAVMTSAGY